MSPPRASAAKAKTPKAKMSKAKRGTAIGRLPRWNLGDLYSGPKSEHLSRDLRRAERRAGRFEKLNKGRLARLSGKRLGEAVAEFEAIDEALGKVMSYAQLLHAADVADPRIGQFY